MAGDHGTAELLKLLEAVKEMTVEEYDDLYNKTIAEISAINLGSLDILDVLVKYDRVTQAKLTHRYTELEEPTLLSSTMCSFQSQSSIKYIADESGIAKAA
jgi:hypothetical protein